MKSIICRLCFLLCLFPVFCEISFHSPDINGKNEVLFTVSADIPGDGSYRTLFLKRIGDGSMSQLTFYPEAMESLSGGSILQLRNRFGTGRYDDHTATFSWVNDFKPFYAGGSIGFGRLSDVKASPDGRWLITVDPVSPARGRLVLFDTEKDRRCVLADSVSRGFIPVSWSPDSSVLIYSIGGSLYFSRPEALFSPSPIDPQYRTLGPGSVASVSWYTGSRFLYVSGKSVYRVQSSELFARSLYSPLLGIGELAGKLPCDFDPSCDRFLSSGDGSAVLYAKGERNVYYCPLSGDDYVSATRPAVLPWLLLPGNTSGVDLSWDADGIPAVFARSIEDGRKTIKAWKLAAGDSGTVFMPLRIPEGATALFPSPDGKNVAFIDAKGVVVYSANQWKEVSSYRDETVVSLAWGEDGVIFVGGAETVRKWSYRTGISIPLVISSVSSAGWDEQGATVLADAGKLGHFSWSNAMTWVPAGSARFRPAAAANASWRIYTDSGKGYYANMIYARSATSPGGTSALVTEPSVKLDPLIDRPLSSAKDSGAEATAFSHGSRSGFRQVAVVFDAMDSLDGLPEILDVLNRYKIRATFFINGEFIRRHPAAVNEIVKAGHQTASLFFTTWDLSGTQYRIDEDFIVRGLSRNEDDFYDATGQELTLLWHAPYYVSSPLILESGKKAGYRYVSPDVTVLDWVSAEQGRTMPGLYRSASDLIEGILAAKKPGSIIPVRVGKVPGGRADYLYEKTDLLINALVEAGYEIVPVDTLIKNAR